MYSMGVPYCCGVDILYGFIYTEGYLTIDRIVQWLEKEIELAKERLKTKIDHEHPDHGLRPIKFLILNTKQNTVMKEHIEKLGFKLIAKEVNLNSGSNLFFYLKNVRDDIKKETKQ